MSDRPRSNSDKSEEGAAMVWEGSAPRPSENPNLPADAFDEEVVRSRQEKKEKKKQQVEQTKRIVEEATGKKVGHREEDATAEVLSHAPHSLAESLPSSMQIPPRKEDPALMPKSDFLHGEGEAPSGHDHTYDDARAINEASESDRLLSPTSDGVVIATSEASSHYLTLGDEIPPLRRVIFVTMPIFSGYATLITFQSRLKAHMGITDKHSQESYIFGVALSMFFLGALLFRFMHNVFLGFMSPRRRIYFAQMLLCASLWIITVSYYIIGTKHLVPVFIAYIGGGVAVGTFESAFISVITPLGHVTKKWALFGMPLGYNGFAVSGFLLLAAIPTDPLLQGIAFGIVGGYNLLGLLIFLCLVPDTPFEASEESFMSFVRKLRAWKSWIPLIWKNMACMFVNMFTVILGSSLILYIFGDGDIPIVPNQHVAEVPTNIFQALVAFFSFSGDFVSRRLAYDPPKWYPRKIMLASSRTGNPIRYLLLNVVGFGLCVSNIAILAPIGMFFIMFGNGSVYSTTTRLIDNHVENQYNLAAISVFLFIGDSGSYIASLVITPVLNLL